jgi:hypothetical protein
LALGGIAGLAIIALGLSAPVCLNGPFAALDPLVRKYWYMGVPEGLPIWEQTPTIAALVIGFPLIGLAGAAWGWFGAGDEERGDWASLIYLAAGSIAVAMMLQRGGALANILALPGALYLISRALPAARRIANAPVRLVATVAVVLLLSPWTLPMIGLLFEAPPTAAEQAIAPQREGGRKCSSLANLAKLNVLPPANLLTPLDIAPLILTATHHRLVASGHHRNQAAMHDVIAAFIGSPGEARRIIEARRIGYVVVCPYQNEPIMFGEVAPQGFWSSISKGRHPDWLEPVDLGDLQSLRIWRVRR